MQAGSLYYHFSEEDYVALKEAFPYVAEQHLLSCDDRYNIWYAPAENSAFSDWVSENLVDLQDAGWDFEYQTFAPGSGGIAGWL